MGYLLRCCLLQRRGSFTEALQHAGPVAHPVKIAPQFESFYTFPFKRTMEDFSSGSLSSIFEALECYLAKALTYKERIIKFREHLNRGHLFI